MVILNKAIKILKEIKEKYAQYDVGCFTVKQYDSFVDECDIEEEHYCINFRDSIVYLKQKYLEGKS